MSWATDFWFLCSFFFLCTQEGVFRSEVQAPCILTSYGASQIYVLLDLPDQIWMLWSWEMSLLPNSNLQSTRFHCARTFWIYPVFESKAVFS